MKVTRATYLGGLSTILALLLIGAFFSLSILTTKRAYDRNSLLSTYARTSNEIAFEERSTALLKESAIDRTTLFSTLNVDVIKIADVIEQVGSDTGVSIAVQSAEPQGEDSIDTDTTIYTYDFVVGGHGAYADIMNAIHRLESLPLVSRVSSVNLVASDSGEWSVVARVTVLTTRNAL